MLNVANRLAVVTGCASGIGKAVTELFLQEGYAVVGIDQAEIAPRPGLTIIQADVTVLEAHKELLLKVTDLGGWNVLVNNAALALYKTIMDTSPAEWQQILDVNLRAPALLCQTLAPVARHGAAIVNVSSVHAFATSLGAGAYAVSKAGMLGLTRVLALELAPKIRVNCLCPGAVDTPMLQRGMASGRGVEVDLGRFAARHPLERIANPCDMAKAIRFLASEDSSFMTGQTLTLDGGVLARLASE